MTPERNTEQNPAMCGKVVLITGASGGIGLAAARLFAAQGARVALAARDADKLGEIAGELEDALAVPTDVTDDAAVRSMVETVWAHYGQLDVLVNNAGRAMYGPLETADLAEYRELLELNTVSALVAMQAVIPVMRAQGGGNIVNVSSGSAKLLMKEAGPYASSKHALSSLSLTARAELEDQHIVVSTVYPGKTDTDIGRNAVGGSEERARSYEGADSPETAARLILEAVQTGAAEVLAESLKAAMQSANA